MSNTINRTQHLLTCLIEECSEIQKDACKSLRFGLDDMNPRTEVKNRQAIAMEINDLLAIVEMLEEDSIVDLDLIGDRKAIDSKKVKVEHYMEYAKQQGVFDE